MTATKVRLEDEGEISTMEWLNEPGAWKVLQSGLSVRTEAETDFWRKTYDDGIRHNGHFHFDSVTGDFAARVKITGKYQSRYDQAGLMVRMDERTWLKCGIEFMDGRQFASTVVTRDYSDWSIAPLPNPPEIWLECQRKDTTLTAGYSLDGASYQMMRQTFLADGAEQQVGMMCAAPKGEGFEVVFEDYSLTVS